FALDDELTFVLHYESYIKNDQQFLAIRDADGVLKLGLFGGYDPSAPEATEPPLLPFVLAFALSVCTPCEQLDGGNERVAIDVNAAGQMLRIVDQGVGQLAVPEPYTIHVGYATTACAFPPESLAEVIIVPTP